MSRSRAKQILIVDDEPVIRSGLAKLLSRNARFRVVGEAADAAEALALVNSEAPDAAFVDLYLPGFHGLPLIGQLLAIKPQLNVIVYTAHDDEYFALNALRAGARGFISKSEPAEHAIVALEAVFSGQLYLENEIRGRLLALVANTPEIELNEFFSNGSARRSSRMP